MKKIILLVLFLLMINVSFGIRLYDDFNRPDNQNISEGYEGGLVYYERPVNVEGTIPYFLEQKVEILNNSLKISFENFCGMNSVVFDFSDYGFLKKYDDGNISFDWISFSSGDSLRWTNDVVFGQDIFLKTSEDFICRGDGINIWDIRKNDFSSKTYLRLLKDRISYYDNLIVIGEHVPLYLENSHSGQKNKITLSFDVDNHKVKIWIDEIFKGEFGVDESSDEQINSVGFSVYNNEAINTQTYNLIDNLEINLNNVEEPSETDPRLYEFAPVFIHHPRELFTPKGIESLLELSDLRKGLVGELIKEGPLAKEDVENKTDRSLNIDLSNTDMYSGFDHPHPDEFSEFDSKIYGRITQNQYNYTSLQYYIFYPFQDWYSTDHEGDWQLVQVTLNDMGAIEDVSYFFNYFRETYYDLDYIDMIEGHPVVYVAEGSHNMHGSDEIFIPFLDELDEELRFWVELMWGLKPLDKINKTGQVFVPETLNFPGETYLIEQISDYTGWINYQGLWGEKHILPYKSGQRGPKYNSRYEFDWLMPSRYTYGTELPFLAVRVCSPLDIILFNSSGKEIYPDVYTGPDSEPELSLTIKEAPYVVVLNATGEGQFNLSVFFYDGDKGINLKYNEISNTATTWAEIDVFDGSDFKLCLDYEPDGVFDICYYPDSFIVHNGYEYEIPDLDNDGIDDLSDNCVNIENTDQADFNDNEKGDVCDNPRYYKNLALNLATNRISKIHIEHSLKTVFWKSDYEIKTPSVFLMELVAGKRSNSEIRELLAEADKLIVEYKLSQIDYGSLNKIEKKKYLLSEKYFERGLQEQEAGKFMSAINYYFKSWLWVR